MPLAPGQRKIQSLIEDHGATPAEVDSWVRAKHERAIAEGFSEETFNLWLGNNPYDDGPVREYAAELQREAGTEGFFESFSAGLQISASGLIARQKAPDLFLPENADRVERIGAMLGQVSGDIPAMLGGFFLGTGAGALTGPGAIIAGTAGAFAAPAAIRELAMQKFENGEVDDFAEFWDLFSGTMIAAAKGGLTGAATGVATLATGPAGLALPRLVGASAELATMVSVGSAIEGHVPELDDFIDGAIVLGGFKGAHATAARLRTIYAKTGRTPAELVEESKSDPSLIEDPLSENHIIPRSLKSGTAARLAREAEVTRAEQQLTKRLGEGEELSESAVQRALEAEGFTGTEANGPFANPGRPPLPVAATVEGLTSQRATPRPPGASAPPEIPADITDLVLSRVGSSGNTRSMTRWNQFVTDYVDRLHPLRVTLRAMNDGKTPEQVIDAYRKARLFAGTEGKVIGFLRVGTADFATNQIVGKGLEQIIRPVRSRMDDLNKYIISRRVLELQERGIRTGFEDPNVMRGVVESARRFEAEFEPVRLELLKYQQELLAYMRDSGVLSTEMFDVIQSENQNYTPFYRVMEDLPPGGLGKALRVQNPVRRIFGGEQKIHNPIESIVKNTAQFINMAERSDVVNTFIDAIARTPHGELGGKRVPRSARPTKLTRDELNNVIDRVRENPEAELTAVEQRAVEEDFSVFRMQHQTARPGEVVAFRDGVREVWRVDNDVAKILNGLDRESVNSVIKFLSVPTKLLRAGAVLSPEFITRNVNRDTFGAAIISGNGFRVGVDSMIGASHVIGRTDLFNQWMRSGAAQAELVALDRNYGRINLKRIMGTTGMIETTRNVLTSPIELLRAASMLGEQATRVGEFRRALPKEVVKGRREPTKLELEAAGFASRNLIDFGRMGAKVQALNNLSAFFNANIQGTARFVEVMSSPKTAAIATLKATALITLPSILLSVLNETEEQEAKDRGESTGFDELPQWQKDFFWVFRTNDGTDKQKWWRVPKPFEFGLLFGTFPERMVRHFIREDPKAFDGYLKSLGTAFVPNPTPTALVPMIEQFGNQNLFTERPIIPHNREKWLPEFQYNAYTTEVSKAIGSLVARLPGGGVYDFKRSPLASPAIIDNYVRAWTGGLGVTIKDLLSRSLEAQGILPEANRPADTLSDVPFIKGYAIRHPSLGAESITRFYDQFEANEQRLLTFQGLIREGEFELGIELAEAVLDFTVDLTRIRETITDISQAVRMLQRDPSIPRDEKNQIIEELRFMQIEIANDGNAIFAEIEENLP